MRTKNFKNRLLSVALMVAMMIVGLGFMGIANNAYAAENEITVYVTVSNAGELAVDGEGNYAVNLPVTVAADETGLATVDAALTALHDTYYPGGYVTSESAYGLAVNKLWGVENGGSYLFAINGVGCSSGVGGDYVGDGAQLTAVIMKDLTYWSDLIAAFDKTNVMVKTGEEVELALTYDAVAYDANWNASHVATPVVGAKVFVAGAADAVLATTDTMGKAVVSFDEPGTYVVTASGAVTMQVQDWSQNGAFVDADAPISAPACVITVEADEPVVDEEEPVVDEDEPVVDEEPVAPEEPTIEEETPVVDEDEPVVEEDEPAVDEEEETDVDEDSTEQEEAIEPEEDTEEKEKSPATGDASHLAVYLLLLMAAASATVFVAKKEK